MKRQRAALGELCTFIKGISPISRTPPGDYPLVTTGEDHRTADRFQLDAEAVCIPLISSTGHGHASLKRVHYQSGKFALSNLLTAALVKDRSSLSTKFLARYLMFTKDRLIVPLMTGAANMSISIDRLATVPVEFPVLADQVRILRLLDELDNLRDLRDEADDRTSLLIPDLFHQTFECSPETALWPVKRLDQLVRAGDKINYGVVQPGPDAPGGVPLVRVGDFDDFRIDTANIKHISPDVEKEYSRSRLQGDEVLISCVGATGAIALADESVRGANIARAVTRVPLSSEVERLYVACYLRSEPAQKYFRRETRTSNQPTLNILQTEQTPVPVPPLPLQNEFARRVTEIRELQAEQAVNRRRLNDLFQSMLHRAFNGEL